MAVSGLAGVACSTMIYASTRRPFWNAGYTGVKFLLTCPVLGIPVALLMRLGVAALSTDCASGRYDRRNIPGPVRMSVRRQLAQTAGRSGDLLLAGATTFTPLRRTALLLTGDLANVTTRRFLVGTLGGVALPGFLLISDLSATTSPALAVVLAVLMVVLCTAGELCERFLFFAAVVAPKMPGAPPHEQTQRLRKPMSPYVDAVCVESPDR